MSIKRLKGKFRLSSSSSVTSQLSIEDWTKYDDRLLECISKNDVTRLKHTLQKKGASPVKISHDGETALHVAVKKRMMTCVDVMLNENPDLTALDMQGRTVYHLAALNGDTIMLKKLLDYSRLNINRTDMNEMTALHYAVSSGESACVKLLLDNSSPMDVKELEGRTPLVLSIIENQEKIALMLIDHGCNIDIADNSGRTPLVLAVSLGMCQVVAALLSKGADKNTSDKEGRTLETIATEAKHIDVVKVLRHESETEKINNGFSGDKENRKAEDIFSSTNGEVVKPEENHVLRRERGLKNEDHSFTSSIIESLRTLDTNSDTTSESSIPEYEIHEAEAEESKRLQENIHRKEIQIQELEAHVTSMTNKLRIEMEMRYAAEKEVQQLMLQLEALMNNDNEYHGGCENDDDAENLFNEENIIHEEEDQIEYQEENQQELKSTAKQHIEMLEEHVITLEEDIANKDNEISELEAKLHETQVLVDFNNNTAISMEQFNEYQVESKLERDNLKREIKSSERSISEYKIKINELEEENMKMKSTLIEESISKEQLQKSLIELEKEIEAFDESDERLKDLEVENHSLKLTIEVESHKTELLEKDIESLEDQIKNYDGTIKDREKEYMNMVCCYRENLLNAFQNNLDNRVIEALSKIIKIRMK